VSYQIHHTSSFVAFFLGYTSFFFPFKLILTFYQITADLFFFSHQIIREKEMQKIILLLLMINKRKFYKKNLLFI
jgi:hypothetical protein